MELESDYDGIRMLAEPRLPLIIEQRDSLVHALWVFKGIDADEAAGTPEETLEEFTIRYR